MYQYTVNPISSSSSATARRRAKYGEAMRNSLALRWRLSPNERNDPHSLAKRNCPDPAAPNRLSPDCPGRNSASKIGNRANSHQADRPRSWTRWMRAMMNGMVQKALHIVKTATASAQ